jgi:hypothetical protein
VVAGDARGRRRRRGGGRSVRGGSLRVRTRLRAVTVPCASAASSAARPRLLHRASGPAGQTISTSVHCLHHHQLISPHWSTGLPYGLHIGRFIVFTFYHIILYHHHNQHHHHQPINAQTFLMASHIRRTCYNSPLGPRAGWSVGYYIIV